MQWLKNALENRQTMWISCRLEVYGFHQTPVWFWSVSYACLCRFCLSISKHSSKRLGPLIRLENETCRLELVCVQLVRRLCESFAQISFCYLSLVFILYFGAKIRIMLLIGVFHLLCKTCMSWKLLGPSDFFCSTEVSEISIQLKLLLLNNPTGFYFSCYSLHLYS